MTKQSEEILELASNQKFRDWVLNTNSELEEYWDRWVKKNPGKESTLQDARRLLLSSYQFHKRHSHEEIMDEFELLKRTIGANNSIRSQIVWYSVAASMILCFALAFLFINTNHYQHNYQTSYGEKRDIVLPDNSHVSLNSNSSIKFDDWDLEREIWLNGEAYFKVQKQFDTNLNNIKFTVHTDDLDIEVIGTEFNVSQRQNGTEVSLKEGKIKLKVRGPAATNEIEMFPGEMIHYSNGSLSKNTVSEKQFASWLDNRLVFQRTPLIEVAKKIEETYGITVIFEDKATSERMISGTIPSDNLEILIRALSVTFSIDVIRTDNQLIFKRK